MDRRTPTSIGSGLMRRRTLLGWAVTTGALAAACTPRMPPPLGGEGLQLRFSEEFDDELNPRVWSRLRGSRRHPYASPFNPHLENASFNPDYTVVRDGNLRIRWDPTPSAASGLSYPYTTGLATTEPGFSFRYGYVETRVFVPNGAGLWHAFWMLPLPVNSWPPEISMIEWVGQEDGRILARFNLHWDRNGQHQQIPGWPIYARDVGGEWHTYGMRWDRSQVALFVDGVQAYSYSGPGIPREKMYVVISGGIIKGATPEAGEMFVDYVRIWQ